MAETKAPREPAAGTDWRGIDTPALLVDRAVLERNIAGMQALADRTGVALRPHAKTHKCLRIAAAQIGAGAIGMTVAKLDEAAMVIDGGVRSVLVANQIATRAKIARALDLARRAELIVGADGRGNIEDLASAARDAGVMLGVSIEIDSGLKRCGVLPADAVPLAALVEAADSLRLAGVFTHGGHAYGADGEAALRKAAREEGEAVVAAAEAIRAGGLDVPAVSIGSTPTVARFDGRAGVTEIRPGNYVFNDGIQIALGVAAETQCALTVAATVISRPEPTRAVIDAGSKAFGLDRGAHGTGLLDHFGRLAGAEGRLVRLSEEHGVMEVPAGSALRPGDPVRVIPNHACVAANLGRTYHVLDGDTVVDRWPADAAGGSR